MPRSAASSRPSKRKASVPASQRGGSRSSNGERARAGAASAGSSPKRSGRTATPILASLLLHSNVPSANRAAYMRAFIVLGATWRTGSRNASSISMPIAPRAPPCELTSCACGLPRWPTCCCAPCVASVWNKRILPTPPVAQSVSSCSRLALWCSSASAESKSGWRQPVPQLMSGDRPPVASPPRAPAPRPPNTRHRIALLMRHHPKAHRDRFFAAPAAQNDSSIPRADRRHITTAPRTLHGHLVWPNYHTWSIELLPRSCALAAHGREHRWTTSLYVKLLLPPRQSRGASLGRLARAGVGHASSSPRCRSWVTKQAN